MKPCFMGIKFGNVISVWSDRVAILTTHCQSESPTDRTWKASIRRVSTHICIWYHIPGLLTPVAGNISSLVTIRLLVSTNNFVIQWHQVLLELKTTFLFFYLSFNTNYLCQKNDCFYFGSKLTIMSRYFGYIFSFISIIVSAVEQ